MAESVTTPFPNGCQGAVSLTFDDGSQSQLKIAIPMLNDRELKATFYLNPRGLSDPNDWKERLAPWKEISEQGHELGNHSISHPCSEAFGDTLGGGGRLENMTLEELEADILEAERRLRELTGTTERTFGYPCYQDFVGKGATRQSYVPVIARHFAAGRLKGEVPNHPLTCDLHHLWSFPVERMSGAEMSGLAARSVAQGRWVILTLHGIHEGHLSVADVDLRELCDFLARRRSDIWVAPAVTVAQRIRTWRKQIGSP